MEQKPLPVSDLPSENWGRTLQCDFCDLEVIQYVSKILLTGLATASVDSTKGDLFKGPSSVVVDLRKEMIQFLMTTIIQTIKPCSIVESSLPQEADDNIPPVERISSLVNEFADLKKNMISRVSNWMLNENRESKIKAFMDEIETEGFWVFEDRETIASTLIRYLDFERKEFHCNEQFCSSEKLEEHKLNCCFRTVNCFNQGCNFQFSMLNKERHDLQCPFKLISCEQGCSQSIMRHEMHSHCDTVCPMKVVNCSFLQAGCSHTFTQCSAEEHYTDSLHPHLLSLLRIIYKQEGLIEDLKVRVQLLEKVGNLFTNQTLSLNTCIIFSTIRFYRLNL